MLMPVPVSAPAAVMPLAAVAFKALVAKLADAVALTRLPADVTLAAPSPLPVVTVKLALSTVAVMAEEAVTVCTLLIAPEASSRLVAAKVRALLAVLALALAETVLSLRVMVPALSVPVLVMPLAFDSTKAVTLLVADWALTTE